MIARATGSRGATALLVVVIAACAPPRRPDRPPGAPPRVLPGELPSLDRWRQHVTDELLPFWLLPDALGTPIGNFPTFRCNDGTRFHPEAPCPELAKPPGWMAGDVDKDFTRMKSRQTYLYGVAFHITGDERYLEYARAGVAWLREHAYERDTGSAVTYWSGGQPGPPPEQRTAQDLAYAQVGLAFYYYLTRDPEVLGDLVRLERTIMTRYWTRAGPIDSGPQRSKDRTRPGSIDSGPQRSKDRNDLAGRVPLAGQPSAEPPGGMLRWVLADGDTPGEARRQELVAQLDQINAYLLLLAPLIEDEGIARAWRRDLVLLARVVKDRFFAPEHGMFWGTLHAPDSRRLGSRHTDFGHSMKSLWMLYLAGELTGELDLVGFARPLIAPLLQRAAQPSGCWASGLGPSGELDRGSQWWIFAELDQAAATLAGREPSPAPYAGYLARSYACWLTRFVDHDDHDVWPGISPDWTPSRADRDPPLKQHLWKNGYHAMEHALVALITTAGLTGRRLPLYYAFVAAPPRGRIRPYYFTGTIVDERDHPLPRHPGLHGRRVEFEALR